MGDEWAEWAGWEQRLWPLRFRHPVDAASGETSEGWSALAVWLGDEGRQEMMDEATRIVESLLSEVRSSICDLENPGEWRIVDMEDTRQWEEVDTPNGSYMKPVRGTGQSRRCDACKSPHEVHVTIENPKTGEQKVVGTSCAIDAGVPQAQYEFKKYQANLKKETVEKTREAFIQRVLEAWPNPGAFMRWLGQNDRETAQDYRDWAEGKRLSGHFQDPFVRAMARAEKVFKFPWKMMGGHLTLTPWITSEIQYRMGGRGITKQWIQNVAIPKGWI